MPARTARGFLSTAAMSQIILNLEEAHDLEVRCANRLGEDALMRRAGAAAAALVAERSPGKRVTILAGPGNNGGDAYACAASLKAMGFQVVVAAPGGAPKSPLAKQLADEWIAQGGAVVEDPYSTDEADAVVDGLFGTGIKKMIRDPYLDAVLWFNERHAWKLALDVPSGLDSETGHWAGGAPGIRADATITFLSQKAGLYMVDGPDAAGEVILSELDVSVPLTRLGLIGMDDFEHVLEPRTKNAHKGTFGHVAVIGGGDGHVGAALLAARAALVMGAGTVTVELLAERSPAVDPVMPELMLSPEPVDPSRFTAVVIGPGLGQSEAAKKRLVAALEAPVPLVIDADAINLIAADKSLVEVLLHRKSATVMTPHEVEGSRLLGVDPKVINANRVDAVRDIALHTGSITVLKGPGTLVSMRSSRSWLSPFADSSLSTAGSGDVLSGMIASLLAQRFDTMEAVLGAVWLHGASPEGCLAGFTAGQIAPAAAKIIHRERLAYAKDRFVRRL